MYEYYATLRDKFHLSDYRVSQMTGIPKSTFTEWKKGTYKPKQEKLQKLADLFEVPVNYFDNGVLTETNEPGESVKHLISYSEGYQEAVMLLKQFPQLQALVNAGGKLIKKDKKYYEALEYAILSMTEKMEKGEP